LNCFLPSYVNLIETLQMQSSFACRI
jgi:hypothetical protein